MRKAERVELRARTDDDEAVLYKIAADLDTWEERSPASPAPLTLAAYRRAHPADVEDRSVQFIVTVDGDAVGQCTLFHEDPLARHAEVGIALLSETRGQGYGTAALRLSVEFGFTRRNLRRLHLCVLAGNAGAIAAYRKVGFIEEGRLRQHVWIRGHYDDEVRMGLLRSEWRS
ncbi:MAG: GNAT family N-acetyltransferase [Pseudonocardiales bacterium]|nr:MAG: GNAT family N-acetyltransferase [Pseudonocardiales bacterium]